MSISFEPSGIQILCTQRVPSCFPISAEIARQKALAEYEAYKSKTADELSEVEKQFIASIDQAEKQLKKLKKK